VAIPEIVRSKTIRACRPRGRRTGGFVVIDDTTLGKSTQRSRLSRIRYCI
jgi:hypothetical protein